MASKNKKLIKYLYSKVDLLFLIKVILAYIFGVGITSYLAADIDKYILVVGLIQLIFILISKSLIKAYLSFDRDFNKTRLSIISIEEWYVLAAISVIIVLVASVMIFFIQTQSLAISSWVFLILIILANLSLAVNEKIQELIKFEQIIAGIFICIFTPAFSLTLTMKEFPSLLSVLAIPLLFMYWGTSIALEFEKYSTDLIANRKSLFIVLGWEKAVFLHHIFILSSFLLIATLPLFGYSWALLWPYLLIMPIGVTEILFIRQISEGLKPQWRAIRITAHTLFLLSLYILTFALFIN